MFGAGGPVVAPADNDVAAAGQMAVAVEILALVFKFDAHALPAVRSDLPQGFTIWKSLLNRFDHVAQFSREHAEQEHNSLFVHRFMREPREVDGIAVDHAVLERRVK